MTETSRDFWPEIAATEALITPLTILKEQAAALAKKTNGLLEARVDTQNYPGGVFLHTFKIVAPTLGHYVFELFTVKHGVFLYPVEIVSLLPGLPVPSNAKTEDEFLELLRVVLSSGQTSKVISALLAQVRA
jgi:hypothetical protein